MPQAQQGFIITSSAQFNAGVVDAAAIATDAVDFAEIAADAVRAAEIQANAVGDSEIAAHTTTKITVPVGNLNAASEAQGDIIIRGASNWQRLGIGSANQILTSNGAAANPSWQTLSAGFVQIDEVILGSAGASLTGATISARKDLLIVIYIEGGATSGSVGLRFNGDTGGNYVLRSSTNGAADSTATGQTNILVYSQADAQPKYIVCHVVNDASMSKLVHFKGAEVNNSGASAPQDDEGTGAWINTADQITQVTAFSVSGGNFVAGSRMTIYAKVD